MKRSFELLLAAVAIVAVLCSGALAATKDGVPYLDENGEHKTQNGVTVIDATTVDTLEMAKDWYVVSGVVKSDGLNFTNSTAVNIILADGARLETSTLWARDAPLTIYAQSTDRDKMGILSANLVDTNTASMSTIYSKSDITIHGGWIKARYERTVATTSGNSSHALNAEGSGAKITVGADAIVEAECIVKGGSAATIYANSAIISHGDVTAKATASAEDTAIAILTNSGTEIAGGVCRATATGGTGSAGIAAVTEVAVKGGWVESVPKISDTTDKNHTGGALIDGDTGTVKGKTVIPAGMAATVRDGVELTFASDAKLTVEQGATLDASMGTLEDAKGKVENDGTLKLPETMKPEEIKDLGITGTGTLELGGKTYGNEGVDHAGEPEHGADAATIKNYVESVGLTVIGNKLTHESVLGAINSGGGIWLNGGAAATDATISALPIQSVDVVPSGGYAELIFDKIIGRYLVSGDRTLGVEELNIVKVISADAARLLVPTDGTADKSAAELDGSFVISHDGRIVNAVNGASDDYSLVVYISDDSTLDLARTVPGKVVDPLVLVKTTGEASQGGSSCATGAAALVGLAAFAIRRRCK